MSQLDFSNSPEGATHFLHAKRVEDIAWFRVVANCVLRWFPVEGNTKQFGWAPIDFLPPMSEAIPAVQAPDWSVAPEGATHWVISERERVPSGWYRADGNKMRCIAQEGEYLFRLDDVTFAGCGLTLFERVPTVVDWSKGPSNATHFGPAGGQFMEAFFKLVDGSWRIAHWENDWFWREYKPMAADRLAMLIARPVAAPASFSPDWATAPDDATHHTFDKCEAPWRKVVGGDVFMWHRGAWELIGMPAYMGCYVPRPAVEFVPRDFSGEVRDYGPGEVDWSQGPEGATAYAGGCWYKSNHLWIDGEWEYQSPETGDHAYEYPDAQYKPEPPMVWNGEGLPPVGIDCERSFSHSTWKATHICGHSTDGAYAAFYDGDGLMGWNDHCKFRPTQTEEQIAEQAKADAEVALAKTLISLMADVRGEFSSGSAAWMAAQLVEEGYSKAVEVSQ